MTGARQLLREDGRPVQVRRGPADQDSSKGGAVETGCSELYAVIYEFVIL